ncbi:MAG: septum formation protein Maf [Candidatus Omnitrophica bacterium]|nr:septum formation protein Maf [Candidatus Omnitrophota bacterium]
MRKIILASQSEQRKKLLKQIGIKFKVVVPKVRECNRIKTNCKDLVIANALLKAKDAACRIRSGVIISADTVVLVGKRIIGKPKSKKDAFKTLKLLTSKPQWVYTGIAVSDTESGKIFTDYAKTKVYMRKVNDCQIRNYLDNVYVMNKAGSFDIQGMGAIFVERIEGCFYNVVGLPLAKLVKILDELDSNIF